MDYLLWKGRVLGSYAPSVEHSCVLLHILVVEFQRDSGYSSMWDSILPREKPYSFKQLYVSVFLSLYLCYWCQKSAKFLLCTGSSTDFLHYGLILFKKKKSLKQALSGDNASLKVCRGQLENIYSQLYIHSSVPERYKLKLLSRGDLPKCGELWGSSL